MYRIVNTGNIEFMRNAIANNEWFDCVFGDPPDNIDLGYDEFIDVMPEYEYANRCHQWLHLALNITNKVWWSFNSRHTPMMGAVVWDLIRQGGRDAEVFCQCNVQTFTFGNHQRRRPTDNHRPLWYITVGEPTFNEVKVPSWREQNGDKRAKAGGKMCGNVMDERSTVFDFPRVTGNSKQRRSYHPTQLQERLVERALLLSTNPGDHVLDIFGGTGTTLRVCKTLGRNCTHVELSKGYCEHVAAEHGIEVQ
jgi:adenine-specific DNA-methyltransferase